MSGFHRIALALLVFAGFSANAAWATSASQIATFEYAVAHDRYGDIGRHTVSFEWENDDLIVEIKSRIAIKVMFWSYRYESDQTEVWRNGKLVAFDGSIRDDNYNDGKRITVKARSKGDKLEIEGPQGLIEAPGGTFASHPWNPKIIEQTQLLDPKTGTLKEVEIRGAADQEFVEVAGQLVRARKYTITGGLQRELWYTDDGRCVKMRFNKSGGDVTITPTSAVIMDQRLLAQLVGSVDG